MGTLRTRLLAGMAIAGLVAGACTAAATPTPTEAPTVAPTEAPTVAPTPMPGTSEPGGHEPAAMIAFQAASATIAVDGDVSDWSAIEGATVNLEQLRLENIDPSQAAEIKFGPLDPVDVTFKVANDTKNLYVLLEVPGDFTYNPADHNLSASVAVMFRVDEPAGPHMGAEEPDIDKSLGIVDKIGRAHV